MRYSRLSRVQGQRSQWQIVVLSLVGIVAIFLIFKFGISALFNLTASINNFRHGSSTNTQTDSNLEIPTTPVLFSDFSATPSATITLKGQADPNSNITLYKDGILSDNILSDSDGKFSFSVSLSTGLNKFTAFSTDSKGKKSDASEAVEISYLSKPPKLEITTPSTEQSSTSSDAVQIVGKTDPGSQITVNDRATIVSSSGDFTYFLKPNNGENKLKIVATDLAGNKTTKEITITKN